MSPAALLSTRARAWVLFCQLTEQLSRLHGLVLRPTSYIRSEEEQFALYLRKLTDCDGHVKRSSHQDARALDCTLEKDGTLLPLTDPAYNIMGTLWLSLDPKNVWGGKWFNPDGKTHDVVHCEYRP